jgi:alkaline phosphatase D
VRRVLIRFPRRTLLQAAAATALAGGCVDQRAQDATFPQGVGSGDPTPDGVLLWTRVEGAQTVKWELATDEGFFDVVQKGDAEASPDADFTVRVEVSGLKPAKTYWYRFTAGKVTSGPGRTRTAPDPDADVPVRIALASCQDYGGRYFHAWRSLAMRDDVDFVLFIGDYIYETLGHLAVELPPERDIALPDGLELDDPIKGRIAALTLADYRTLYRTYRADADLKLVHARFPFVSLWDDHEFANDCWGDHAVDFDDARGSEEEPDRRAAATRAWYEFNPIRRPFKPEAGWPDDLAPQRSVRWGRHAEFVLLDERYHRSDNVIPEGVVDKEVGHFAKNSAFGARTFAIKDVFDQRELAANPTMLGLPQRDWAIAQVQGSTATWKLLTSPLVMAQMVLDLSSYEQLPDLFRKRFYFKTDQWDGYRTERRAVLEACAGVDNLAVLSGDLHGFYASTLHADFDAPSAPIAVEYAVSAVSAPTVDVQLAKVIKSDPVLDALGLGKLVPQFDANILATNPHIKHSVSTKNGLAIVDVRPEALSVTFFEQSDVLQPIGDVARAVTYRTPVGTKEIEKVG